MAKFTAQAGIDPLLRVDLDPGDEVAAERGSMVMMDAGLILKGKTRGGFFKSLAQIPQRRNIFSAVDCRRGSGRHRLFSAKPAGRRQGPGCQG